MKPTSNRQPKEVAVIGGGWNGAHIAKVLAEKPDRRFRVTLYEQGPDIFNDISGKFGIRIHVGPHYPRSPATRKTCRDGFNEFLVTYPQLVNDHAHSVYAVGKKDSDDQPSKVTADEFENICMEFKVKGSVDCRKYGYNAKNVLCAFDFNEPSAALGPRLRSTFHRFLTDAKVIVKCNFSVTTIKKQGSKILVGNGKEEKPFDYVINTTSYKALLPTPRPLPFNIEIVYQPCLALVYTDTNPDKSGKPISFIVMDGWFPCLMPYDDRRETDKPITKYIMTHGKWTIMGSYKSAAEANKYLSAIDDNFINKEVKTPSEQHMAQFWPKFSQRFQYAGWVGAVLAKINTNREYRGAIVFQDATSGVICVFPGKITNIFDAERETLALMNNQNIITGEKDYRYVKEGTLYHAAKEISEKGGERSTCQLQTFRELLRQKTEESSSHEEGSDIETDNKPTKQSQQSRWIDGNTISKNILIFGCTAVAGHHQFCDKEYGLETSIAVGFFSCVIYRVSQTAFARRVISNVLSFGHFFSEAPSAAKPDTPVVSDAPAPDAS